MSGETKENHYQYGGKELNGDLGLNWMDFGGRWYMADLCRWGQVDPLAEQGYSRTPYHYVRNNPLAFVDPTGLGEDPAPLPGATVYSEENANRKQRKEAYDEWQRERDREYGLSSERGFQRFGNGPIIHHRRRKGETRSSIAKKYGVDRKFVNQVRGTPRGSIISVVNVKWLEGFRVWLNSLNVNYQNPVTGNTSEVKGNETLYGIFAESLINNILKEGITSPSLLDANNDFIPLGLPTKVLDFDEFSSAKFRERIRLFDKSSSELSSYIYRTDPHGNHLMANQHITYYAPYQYLLSENSSFREAVRRAAGILGIQKGSLEYNLIRQNVKVPKSGRASIFK